MEEPLPWERLLWRGGALFPPGVHYLLTDFRLVRTSRGKSEEIAIDDVGEVHQRTAPLDRILNTSTLVVHPRSGRRPLLVLSHVRHGAQLAALLELLADDPRASWDSESVRAALAWEPRGVTQNYGGALVGVGALIVTIFAVAIVLHGKARSETYAPDDEIYPGGIKKDREEIVRFMETSVMPWARQVLGVIKGGPSSITCETCHGWHAEARGWQMPAVAALPRPVVVRSGWELYSSGMDAQMRNAIYGYVAESDKQAKAAYMREAVMPGMAALLRRPAYDFTQTYDFNRTRVAFGCYHCHQVH